MDYALENNILIDYLGPSINVFIPSPGLAVSQASSQLKAKNLGNQP